MKHARTALLVAGLVALLLGLVVSTGRAHVLPVHELAGDIAVASLWTLAFLGWRSGLGKRLVGFAVGWGVLEFVFVGLQQVAFSPALHATTQVLHVVSSIGVVVTGLVVSRAALNIDAGADIASRPTLAAAAAAFLANKRIAVTGVSRSAGSSHGANIVYRRLRERGYEVFAVNPNAETVEGDRAHHQLRSIAGGVDAVVIATRPEHAMDTVRECAELGIRNVWMHRGVGGTSVSQPAAAWARANGIRVIDGGCPLMFAPASDPGHRVMCGLLTLTGKLPRRVA